MIAVASRAGGVADAPKSCCDYYDPHKTGGGTEQAWEEQNLNQVKI